MANTAKSYRIPSSFTLFGHKYRVKFCDDLHDEESCFGVAEECKKLIRLQSQKSHIFLFEEVTDAYGETKIVKEYFEITDERLLETYFHELAHIILDAGEYRNLSDNEKLVNLIAKGLLEVYLSSEYEEVSKQ